MSHSYHPDLPNYVPDALFHTGCPECGRRASLGIRALGWLDEDRVVSAVRRARAFHRRGGRLPEEASAGDGRLLVDEAELQFLTELGMVLAHLRQTLRARPELLD